MVAEVERGGCSGFTWTWEVGAGRLSWPGTLLGAGVDQSQHPVSFSAFWSFETRPGVGAGAPSHTVPSVEKVVFQEGVQGSHVLGAGRPLGAFCHREKAEFGVQRPG